MQKQSPGSVLKKIRKIHREVLVSESFFDKVTGYRPAILLIRDSDIGVFI